MEKTVYYATPKQVQELAIRRHNENKSNIGFPEGLAELLRSGELTTERPPIPLYKINMSTDEFDEYVLSYPFPTEKIVAQAPTFYNIPKIDEPELFPYQNDVFCYKHLPYMSSTYHTDDFFGLTLAYKGTFSLRFENETLTMNEGDLCIIPPNSPYCQIVDPSVFALGISIRKSTFDKVFGNLLVRQDLVSTFFRNSLYGSHHSNYLRMKTELTPRLLNVVQQLTYESYQNDLYANSSCTILLNLFFNLVLRKYSDSITFYNNDVYSQRDYDFALILQYIQNNYQTVTLSSLADMFHFNDTYLSKLFQKHLGKSFSSLLREVRMEKAVQLLSFSNLKIYEISEKIGYSSVDHFSRAFKSTFGITPKHYQLNNQCNATE